jgi:hypothetical protein
VPEQTGGDVDLEKQADEVTVGRNSRSAEDEKVGRKSVEGSRA